MKKFDYPLGIWLLNKHNRQIAKVITKYSKVAKGTTYFIYTLQYPKGLMFSVKYSTLKRNWIYSEAAQILYSKSYEGRL